MAKSAEAGGAWGRVIRGLGGTEGFPGRVALSWTVAGGFVGGVLLVDAMIAGVADSSSLPYMGTALFGLGAVAGFVHGSILGLAGRPDGISNAQAIRAIEVAALWALPLLLVAWVAALWLAMTAVALEVGSRSILFGALIGWAGGILAAAWAAMAGVRALSNALGRWPEHRPGALLISHTFVGLLVAFVVIRPEIWWTDFRVSSVGAVVLAIGATFWIVIPVIVVVLHFLHQWLAESPVWDG
jgi:hypothetical protein